MTMFHIFHRFSTLFILPLLFFSFLSLLTPAAWSEKEEKEKKAPQDLSSPLLNSSIWNQNQDEFEKNFKEYGFRWTSKNKNSSRSTSSRLTFEKEHVLEAIVRFQSSGISEVVLSFFNRGDAGRINEADFQSHVQIIEDKIKKLTGSEGEEITTKGIAKGRQKAFSKLWKGKDQNYRLDWAFQEKKRSGRDLIQPEHITLTLLPPKEISTFDLVKSKEVKINYGEIRKRIKNNPQGDVWLEGIPMVDQGEKGYCANATTERVLRYYGSNITQHEIAQRANTESSGTSPKQLLKALKSMGRSFEFKIDTLDMLKSKDFYKFVDRYNKAAKKNRLEKINLTNSIYDSMSDVYRDMDKELFIQTKNKKAATIRKFEKNITEKINEGIPLLWGVTLGIVKERKLNPQAFGGHMRLIFGYNKQTKEILYTDSWGKGHENKRMKIPKASAITSFLFTIEQR